MSLLVLEVVTGKKVSDYIAKEECALMEWLWRLHKSKRLVEASDPSMQIENKEDNLMVTNVLELGLSCCYAEPSARPSMRYALQVLCGDIPPLPLPSSLSSPFSVSMDFPNYSTSLSTMSSNYTLDYMPQPQ